MQFKIPKNTKQFFWTRHVLEKMRYYGLSAQKISGVINRPQRKEEGIVKKTIAVMQPVSPKIKNGEKVWKQEIWCMYQKQNKAKNEKVESINPKQIKIISAWRYPGVSPKKNPIPEEILKEIDLI
jgi:hypothetical protein